MICSVCGGTDLRSKVLTRSGFRLEGTVCATCGSGEATGWLGKRLLRFVRDYGIGADTVYLSDGRKLWQRAIKP